MITEKPRRFRVFRKRVRLVDVLVQELDRSRGIEAEARLQAGANLAAARVASEQLSYLSGAHNTLVSELMRISDKEQGTPDEECEEVTVLARRLLQLDAHTEIGLLNIGAKVQPEELAYHGTIR